MLLAKKEKYAGFGIKGLTKRFTQAALSGNLKNIRYFLLVEKLDIHFNNDFVFRMACKKGYLEVVRYVLTSEELTEHCDIHSQVDLGFRKACEFGQLSIVQYLTTSSELKEHANVYAKDNIALTLAKTNGNQELQKYLLYFKLDQKFEQKFTIPKIKL